MLPGVLSCTWLESSLSEGHQQELTCVGTRAALGQCHRCVRSQHSWSEALVLPLTRYIWSSRKKP